jgi:hypothetical protein
VLTGGSRHGVKPGLELLDLGCESAVANVAQLGAQQARAGEAMWSMLTIVRWRGTLG